MAKVQYKKCFAEMLAENPTEFKSFSEIHEKFKENPAKYRKEYNQQGEKILEIIKKYESILCGRSEGAGFGFATSTLSDKFWGLIRALYSEIDEIGIE